MMVLKKWKSKYNSSCNCFDYGSLLMRRHALHLFSRASPDLSGYDEFTRFSLLSFPQTSTPVSTSRIHPLPPPHPKEVPSLQHFGKTTQSQDLVKSQGPSTGSLWPLAYTSPWPPTPTCSHLSSGPSGHQSCLLFLLLKPVSSKGVLTPFLSSTTCLAWIRAISMTVIPHPLITSFVFLPVCRTAHRNMSLSAHEDLKITNWPYSKSLKKRSLPSTSIPG